MCKVSVVTSIYNGEQYIGETIESILHQTFADWEYIIIDNASTDASTDIIESYAKKDSRIRFYRNKENLGVSANLNKGFELARGKYIARTDADDLSYPTRLEKQYQYMEEHPNIALLGCKCDIWRHGNILDEFATDIVCNNPDEIRVVLPFANFIAASTFFVRKEFIWTQKIAYRPYIYAEDYGLLLDVLKCGEIFSLQDHLVVYRIYPEQVTQTVKLEIQERERIEVQMFFLENFPYELRDIFCRAFQGAIHSQVEMQRLGDAIAQYAKKCGLGKSIDELAKNKCVQYVYRCVYDWQIGNIGLLRAYMKSPLKFPHWFLRRRGISLIKQCVLQEDRCKWRMMDHV